MQDEDDELIARAKAGDLDACEALVARFTAPAQRLAALLAAVVLAAATPQGRAFAGHLLRFAGVEFSGTPGPTPAGSPSLPGQTESTLDQARRQAGFPLLVPSALGPPDQVIVSDGGRVVTLQYGPIRLEEFDGRLNTVF
ncbi:MAG: hypothetical protein ABIS86_10055, partial [Streptosporangiaceae bacterium]